MQKETNTELALRVLLGSQEFNDLCAGYRAAKERAEAERERVRAYTIPLFEKYEFSDTDTGERITDPDDVWKDEDDEKCDPYYKALEQLHIENGSTYTAGESPDLVAQAFAKSMGFKIGEKVAFVMEVGILSPIKLMEIAEKSLELWEASQK